MTSGLILPVLDVLIDLTMLVVLVTGALTRRFSRRWRGTFVALSSVVAFNLAQSVLAMQDVPSAGLSTDRLLHVAEIASLTTLVFVFRRELAKPDRLLARANAKLAQGSSEMDAVPAIVLMSNRDGVVRHINRHGMELLGQAGASLLGQEIYRLVPKGTERRRLRAEFMLFVGSAGSMGSQSEYSVKTSRGWRLIRWRRTAQLDNNGSVVGVVSHGEDITESRETQERLAAESYLLDSVYDAVIVLDRRGMPRYFNRAAHEMLGHSPEEFAKLRDQEMFPAESRPAIEKHLEAVKRMGYDSAEVLAQSKSGEVMPVELRSQVIRFEHDECVMTVVRDVSSRKQAQSLVEQLAFTDALTGLPNRRAIQERITAAMKRGPRSHSLLAVFYLDLDNLKSVNDTLGHEGGDELIRIAGERLKAALREHDTIGRIGGDEFVILLPEIDSEDVVDEIAQRLLDAFSEPLLVQGQEVFSAASMGVVICDEKMTAEEVISRADRAMYVAKRSGGRRYIRHCQTMDEEYLDRFVLKNELFQALDRGELELEFQPIVDASTGVPQAAEALLRWRHPMRGLLSPGIFIELAEQNGSIRDIGKWVLRESCSALAEWRLRGVPLKRVTVNVSPVQLSEPYFVSDVLLTLEQYGLDVQDLELEITETQAMEHSDEIEAAFAQLHSEGVRLALDDFGVGHSSLERLRRLPISTLKLDRTFVADLCHASTSHPIIDTVLVLASNLRLNVVAEGVETSCQAHYLREAGCAELQGYGFARPMSSEHIVALGMQSLEASTCDNPVCLKAASA